MHIHVNSRFCMFFASHAFFYIIPDNTWLLHLNITAVGNVYTLVYFSVISNYTEAA